MTQLRESAGNVSGNALGQALLQIYRLSRTTPAPEFKDAALEALKLYLPFEKAMWGTFVDSEGAALVHAVHLHKLPRRKMRDYEQVKQSDVLHRKCIAHPGHTSIANLGRMEKTLDPKLVAYVRRYHMENVLSTVWVDPVLQICTAVSLYRGDAGRPYTERERRLKQQLMPHLVEAWNLNAIQYVDQGPGTAHSPQRAMIDREGMLYNSEPGFAGLMRAEFAGWTGPTLPAEVVRPLAQAGGESYRGGAVIISRLREIEDGMYLIGVRALAGIDRLSPRERSVARSFASGKTYKEIAQALGVAPATVRNQLQAAYTKLGVGSKIELSRQLDESD